jgi:tetratricopeptide (TPR) repeat protein
MNTDQTKDPQELPDFDKFWQHANPAETEKKFHELLPMAEASGNVAYHAELLTQTARTEGLQNRFDEAHATLDRAEASDQQGARVWLGALDNNIGWNYFDKQQFQEALEIFEKALAWRQTNKTSPLSELIARWSVARVLRALGRVEEALSMQQALQKSYEESDLDSDGFVFEELAECKLALGQPGHVELFARAYELLKDTWVAQHEADRLARIKELGKVDHE